MMISPYNSTGDKKHETQSPLRTTETDGQFLIKIIIIIITRMDSMGAFKAWIDGSGLKSLKCPMNSTSILIIKT